MPTPTAGYELNGRRIPSVSSILNIGLGGYSKDALMAWSWKEGKEGRDYRETRQKAADAGTIAHAMIEAFLNGDAYVIPADTSQEMIDQADAAYRAFLEWHAWHRIVILDQEVPLVCPVHRFGGTFDALGMLDDVPTLFDWKTSSGVYSSYPVQIAAYQWLIAQHYGHAERPQQAVIVRVGKDGGLRVVTLNQTQLSQCWAVFKHALAVYQAKRELEAMIAPPSAPTITRLPVTRKGAA